MPETTTGSSAPSPLGNWRQFAEEHNTRTRAKGHAPIPVQSVPIPSGTSLKQLAHTAGDFIALQSEQEGSYAHETSQYMVDLIKEAQNSDEFAGVDLDPILETMELFWSISKKISEIKGQDAIEAINELIHTLAQQIEALPADERFLIPAGWSGQPQGHAMAFAIERQIDGKYSVYVFNTGEGIDTYHGIKYDAEGILRYPTVKCWEGVSQESLTNPLFLRAFLELKAFPLSLTMSNKGHDIIYDSVLGLLDGKEVIPPAWALSFQKGQRSGTCAWASLMAHLHDKLPIQTYKKLKFWMRCKSLERYVQEHPLKESKTQTPLVFAAQIAEKLIRTLEKDAAGLTEQEQRPLLNSLLAIKTEALSLQAKKKVPDALSLDLESPIEPFIGALESITPFPPLVVNPDIRSESLTDVTVAPPNITQQTLLEEVKRFRMLCEGFYKEKNYHAARHFANLLAAHLPPVTGEIGQDPFWDLNTSYSTNEFETLISDMAQINDILYRSVFHLGQSSGQDLSTATKTFLLQGKWIAKIGGYQTELQDNQYVPFGIDNVRYSCHPLIYKSLEKLNLFSHSRTLTEEMKVFAHQLINGEPFYEFISNSGEFFVRGRSFSKEFQELYQNRLEEKAKELGIDPFSNVFKNVVIADFGQLDILPPALAALNKQGFLLYLFQSGGYFKQRDGKESEENDFTLEIPSAASLMVNSDFVQYPLIHIKGAGPIYPDRVFPTVKKEWIEAHVDNPEVAFLIRSYLDTSFYNPNQILQQNFSDSDYTMTFKTISREEWRELITLINTPKEMCVWQTLSHFSRYWDRLEDPNFQAFFHLMLDRLIAEELNVNPLGIEQLQHFLELGFDQFSAPEKFQGFLFCTHLALNIKARLAAGSPEKEHWDDLCQNWEAELVQRIQEPHYTADQKRLCEVLLAQFWLHRPATAECVGQVLLAKVCQHSVELPLLINEPSVGEDYDRYLFENVSNFVQKLQQNSAFADRMLGKIAKIVYGAETSGWHSLKYPFFESGDGAIRINCVTGETECRHAGNILMPRTIMQSRVYRAVFGNRRFPTKVENFNRYTFTVEGQVYRIQDFGRNQWLGLEKLVDGKWYRFFFDEFGDTSPACVRQEGMTHWQSVEGNVALFQDHAGHVVYKGLIGIYIPGDEEPSFPYIYNLLPLNAQGAVEKFTLAAESPAGFAHFEESQQIQTWNSSETGKISKILIPNYQLMFQPKKNDSQNFYCKEHPGFYLSKNQHLSELPFVRHFLILENHKGQKRVLIPSYSVEMRPSHGASRSLKAEETDPLAPKALYKKKFPGSYISVDLDSEGNLVAIKGEQAIALAVLALIDRDYESAKALLDRFESSDVRNDLKEPFAQLLDWFWNSQDNTVRFIDPKALAILSKACLLIYDKERLLHPETGNPPYFLSSYGTVELFVEQYVNSRNNAGVYQLKDEEEKRLLHYLMARVPLGYTNFGRLMRLQNAAPLEPKVLEPVKLNRAPTQGYPITQAKGEVFSWFRQHGEQLWNGKEVLYLGSLVSAGMNSLPYFLDCCRRIDYWSQGSQKPEVLAHLRVMHHTNSYGARLLHDCLLRIIQNPSVFETELADLQAIYALPKLKHVDALTSWLDRVVQRVEQIKGTEAPFQARVLDWEIPLRPSGKIIEQNLRSFKAGKEQTPHVLLEEQPIVEELFNAVPIIYRGRIPRLDPVEGDAAGNRQIELLNKQLDSFYAKRAQTPQLKYTLKQTSDFTLALLKAQEKKDVDLLRHQKKEILELAHLIPIEKAFAYEKRKGGGRYVPVTMDELVGFYFRQDDQALLAKCPGISKATCPKIYRKIEKYLIQNTHLQQIRRSQLTLKEIIKLENYQKSGIKEPDVYYPPLEQIPGMLDYYQEKLAGEMLAKPAYSFRDHPEYLAIESLANIRLRPQQVVTLALMLQGGDVDSEEAKELIVQLLMGEGKTKVLLPLLAAKLANGKQLPIVVVPDGLFETNSHDLSLTSHCVFGQQPFIWIFHRNSSLEIKDLRFALMSLQNCLVDKNYAIMTASTLKCLKLKYQELLQSGDPMKEEQFQLLRQIILLLRENGVSLMDEADLLLEARRSETNFSGSEKKPLSEERIVVGRLLLDTLMSGKTRHRHRLQQNKQTDMSEKDVKSVQEEFVDALLARYPTELVYRPLLRDYLLGRTSKKIPNLKYEPHYKLWKQAKEITTKSLSTVFSKSCNKDYGRSHEDLSCRKARPYVANNTPDERSDFGHTDELMLYTGFMYIQEGLSPSDVDYLLSESIRKIRAESKAQHIPFRRTPTFQLCQERLGIPNIFNVSTTAREALTKRVQSDSLTLHYWLENFVYPDIEIFTQKLSANSLDMVDLFKHNLGFAGILWNRLVFHDRLIHPELDEKTSRIDDEIAVLDAIWRQIEGDEAKEQGIYVVDADTPMEYLEAILKIPDLRCLIDVGALLKGVTNEKVAKRIQELNAQGELTGTVYFDEHNRIVVSLQGMDEPVTLDRISLEKRFTYYAQRQTTGADIEQLPKATAALTFAYNTTRDMSQGAMRMRQLLRSQKVKLIVPSSIAQKMAPGEKIHFKHLLRAGVLTQTKRLSNDLVYATKCKLHHICKQTLFHFQLGLADFSESVAFQKKFEEMLTDFVDDEPPDDPLVLVPTLEVLEGVRQRKIESIKQLFQTSDLLSPELKLELEPLQMQILLKLQAFILPAADLLPEKQPKEEKAITKQETHIETEKENEVEAQLELPDVRQASYTNWSHAPDADNLDFLKPYSNLKNAPSIIDLEEVFSSTDDLKSFQGLFDPQLLTTSNFVKTAAGQVSLAFEPGTQKACYQVMAYLTAEGEVQVLIVDPTEGAWLRKALRGQQIHHVQFIDLENGFTETIGREFTKGEKRRIMELVAQAKFYSGTLSYLQEELDYLQSWMAGRGGKKLFKELFEKSIRSYPGRMKLYEGSAIQELLLT